MCKKYTELQKKREFSVFSTVVKLTLVRVTISKLHFGLRLRSDLFPCLNLPPGYVIRRRCTSNFLFLKFSDTVPSVAFLIALFE